MLYTSILKLTWTTSRFKRSVLAHALKVGLENMPWNLGLQETLTQHYTTSNIVSILSVH